MGFCHFPTGIKLPKPKSVLRQRQTIAKQVKSTVGISTNAAYLIALRGKKFTPLQELLNIYRVRQQQLRRMKSSKRDSILETFPWGRAQIAAENRLIKHYAKMERRELCQILMDAIDAEDSEKVSKIAEAIKFLKTFKESGDVQRATLLHWKQILDMHGEKWPIRKVAEAVAWPDMKSADSFSRLRRLCKELNFPLAPSRQIRRK